LSGPTPLPRRQLRAAIGAGVSALLFCLLAWATAGQPTGFDRPILLALRDAGDTALPLGPTWLGQLLRAITTLAASATLGAAAAVAAAAFALRRRFAVAAFVVAAIGGAIGLGSALKQVFARVRPDVVTHLVETHTTSFPSGHALNSAAACVTLCVLLAGVGNPLLRYGGTAAAIVFAVLAGFSRVYFGVHWPSDVLAGWCAGAAWALLCAWALAGRGKR